MNKNTSIPTRRGWAVRSGTKRRVGTDILYYRRGMTLSVTVILGKKDLKESCWWGSVNQVLTVYKE